MATTTKNNVRRTILDETRSLLVEQGITQISIRMIAKKVGCSVGTIYFYFENKDVLIHALIEEGFDKLVGLLENVLQQVSDPMERLKVLCRKYFDFAIANPEYYEIMYMLKPERMARYPAEKYRKARRSLEIFSATLEEATQQGLRQVTQPYLSAHLIWSFMHGIVSLLQVKRIDRRISQQEIIDSSISQISQMPFI